MEIGLSLGSNLGDRLNNLKLAKEKITAISGVQIVARSPVYVTEPVDVPPEHRNKQFLNAVLIIKCDQEPRELSRKLLAIEKEMGRVRKNNNRNMPRLIDIDIICADQVCVNDEALTVPHPRWAERRFVVQPLADVRPDIQLPGEKRTVHQVLLSLPQTPKVISYAEKW